MHLITRKEWNARPSKGELPRFDPHHHKGVVIHYTASCADQVTDRKQCASRVRAIQAMHQNNSKEGYLDIAYNFLVCIHGDIFEGRGLTFRSGAQGGVKGETPKIAGGNITHHAICFLGGDKVGRADVTDAAKTAIDDCIALIRTHYVGKEIRPHSDFTHTACCGDELRAFIAAGSPRPR